MDSSRAQAFQGVGVGRGVWVVWRGELPPSPLSQTHTSYWETTCRGGKKKIKVQLMGNTADSVFSVLPPPTSVASPAQSPFINTAPPMSSSHWCNVNKIWCGECGRVTGPSHEKMSAASVILRPIHCGYQANRRLIGALLSTVTPKLIFFIYIFFCHEDLPLNGDN